MQRFLFENVECIHVSDKMDIVFDVFVLGFIYWTWLPVSVFQIVQVDPSLAWIEAKGMASG